MDFIRSGIRALAGGARRGNALLAGLGTAAALIGAFRRFAGPSKRLLYSRTLQPGETLRIRLAGSDEETEAEG